MALAEPQALPDSQGTRSQVGRMLSLTPSLPGWFRLRIESRMLGRSLVFLDRASGKIGQVRLRIASALQTNHRYSCSQQVRLAAQVYSAAMAELLVRFARRRRFAPV